MIGKDELSEVDQYAVTNIECRVRGLIGHYGFTEDDREDLVQQLFLEYLERIGDFCPSRARQETFVSCLIRNQVISMIRARRRELAAAATLPLGAVDGVDAGEGEREADGDDHPSTADRATFRSRELIDLKIDVDRVLASLPPHLREVGVRVVAEGPQDLGHSLGRSRARVHQWLRQIREAFQEAGLAPPRTRRTKISQFAGLARIYSSRGRFFASNGSPQ